LSGICKFNRARGNLKKFLIHLNRFQSNFNPFFFIAMRAVLSMIKKVKERMLKN